MFRKGGELLQVIKKVSKALTVMMAILLFFLGTSNLTKAAEWEDGEYSATYSVLKADSDSASMADGYFVKPAKLVIENGSVLAQVSINTSSITEFKVNGKAVTILSESGDSSTVQFAVNDLNTPTNGEIHVVVEGMDYDHWYTIRFDFDTSNVAVASTNVDANGTQSSTVESDNTSDQETTTSTDDSSDQETSAASSDSNETKIENPRTNDTTNITLYVGLLLISTIVMVFILVRKSKARMIEK